jgi:hypothetical protein
MTCVMHFSKTSLYFFVEYFHGTLLGEKVFFQVDEVKYFLFAYGMNVFWIIVPFFAILQIWGIINKALVQKNLKSE